MGSHIKEDASNFHSFEVLWTPTVLIMDTNGIERVRNEGYLPKTEFRAWLEMGLARLAFIRKAWDESERRYDQVTTRFPKSWSAPEAVYWRGVSRYKKNDRASLGETAAVLKQNYPESLWAQKASVWTR